MEFSLYIAFLIFNSLIYWLALFLLFKRQSYSFIALRSPVLTVANCVCGFVMTNLLICYELLEDKDKLFHHQMFCRYLPFPFIICHLFFVLTFIFRKQRILRVCMNSSNEKTKAQEFYAKRTMLTEKYYLKFFILWAMVIAAVMGFVMVRASNIKLPFYFQKCIDNTSSGKSIHLLSIWVFFIENLVLITYGYLVYKHELKTGPKFELLLQIIVLIIQPNIAQSIYNSSDDDYPFHKNVLVFIIINHLLLIMMVYYPAAMTLKDKVKISYHFTPKLNSNLYLFLSDEICYYSFSDFMKHTETDNFYISLYTQIMKYKYKYTLEPDYYTVLDDAKSLYKSYFEKEIKYFNKELINRIRSTCLESINKGDCTYEMFDDALVFVYDVLEKIFIEYRRSDEYFLLVDSLNLHSYALLKMCESYTQQAYSL